MLSLLSASTLAYSGPVLPAVRPALARSVTPMASAFDDGMGQFKADYPWLAKYGFGPTVKAERWNGRHAMFGWLCIIATAECQKWGLFPDAAATTALTYKQWGALTQMGFNEYISNERAIIMIAHIHFLAISMAAAFGPRVLGDSLTLLDDEEDEEPYGLFPPFKGQTGLTPAAEIYNGRMAMLGLIAVVLSSFASGKDILEVVDIGLGNFISAPPF